MKGDCARDKLGRPVIASIGMLHGTVEDMEKQLVYVTPSAGGGAPHQCPQVNDQKRSGRAISVKTYEYSPMQIKNAASVY